MRNIPTPMLATIRPISRVMTLRPFCPRYATSLSDDMKHTYVARQITAKAASDPECPEYSDDVQLDSVGQT